jgi:hypothetical protein
MVRRPKLSVQAVRFIRGSQEKQGTLAKRFGVTQTAVHQIQNRVSYQYVEDCDICDGKGLVCNIELYHFTKPCPVCQRQPGEVHRANRNSKNEVDQTV